MQFVTVTRAFFDWKDGTGAVELWCRSPLKGFFANVGKERILFLSDMTERCFDGEMCRRFTSADQSRFESLGQDLYPEVFLATVVPRLQECS